MTEGRQSAARRLSLITVDQAIAGASNVVIAVLAARVLGVASFGLFGIVFLAYVMVQGVSRALIGDPTLVHPDEAFARRGPVLGTGVLLGGALALVVLAAGYVARFWNAELGSALLVLGLCVPLLVVQDLGRYLGFAFERPAAAVVLDVAWLIALAGAITGLEVTGTRSLAWFIGAWGGSGALAGLLVFCQHPVRELRFGRSWLTYTWPFSWRYLISYSASQGAALVASSAVGGIAGTRALAGVQGTLLLVRPYMTFQVAAVAASVGEVARDRRDRSAVRRHVRRASSLAGGVAVLNALVLVVLPDDLGRMVLGDSWAATKPLLLPTGVQLVFLGLTAGLRAGLLGQRAIRRALAIDIATTVVVVTTITSGALLGGAAGALWAVAAGQAAMSFVWYLALLASTSQGGRHRVRPRPRPSWARALTEPMTPVGVSPEVS